MQKITERYEHQIKRILDLLGYEHLHWTRPVMYADCRRLLESIRSPELDTLEISAGKFFKTLPFKSYSEANFPEFDICRDRLEQKFDLIIADQVFEHLLYPRRAVMNIISMLKPGGYFLVTAPFMIRYHPIPTDCTRWTETGMKHFLHDCGFELDAIKTNSWGNRQCVKANFDRWARRGWFGSLKNDPNFPVVVWALARWTQ